MKRIENVIQMNKVIKEKIASELGDNSKLLDEFIEFLYNLDNEEIENWLWEHLPSLKEELKKSIAEIDQEPTYTPEEFKSKVLEETD